jgi:hypothetical protein
MAGMIFESLNSTLPNSKDQQHLKDKFSPIFDALESAVRSISDRPAEFSEFNFNKMHYKIPDSFFKPVATDRSRIVVVEDKKDK